MSFLKLNTIVRFFITHVNMKGQKNFYFYITCFAVLYDCRHTNGKRFSQIFAPEMIAKEGYPVETHLVTTEDGYINTLHRIPGPPGSTPVFLQHGVCESSTDWLYNGKNGSLAYLLHQLGYDVWLGNARGNIYSTLHTNLTTSDAKYWDFSWDEQGLYDNPAAITHIYNTTNKKMFYISHSMGGTSFAAMASTRLDVAQNIKAMFALAPSVYGHNNQRSVLALVSHFWKEILAIGELLNIHQIAGRNWFLNFLSDYVCPIIFIHQIFCDNALFIVGGFNRPELPKDISPEFISKVPAGTSLRVIVHRMQQIRSPKMRHFNYLSSKKNMELYGSNEPPVYDLSKIQVPVALFYSHNDRMVGYKDAEQFYKEVPNKLGIYPVDPYSHFDFVIGLHASQRVYSQIFKLMAQFN